MCKGLPGETEEVNWVCVLGGGAGVGGTGVWRAALSAVWQLRHRALEMQCCMYPHKGTEGSGV